MPDFSGKRVLVTGASRGIGRAVAGAFAEAGATLAVNYRADRKSATQTLRSLPGGGHFLVEADVSVADDARRAVEQTIAELNGLDIVVNNAGVWEGNAVDSVSFEEWCSGWQKTIGVNLIGPANICYFAVRHMMKHGGGRIVNISSRGAFRGEAGNPAYAASKGGLNSLSQSLAIAVAPYRIFVGVVAPGFVETDMTSDDLAGPEGDTIRAQSPLNRVARPEEVANAVLFLASDGAEFTTGTIIDVNGASFLRM